jgi:hypothetical protein
VWAITALGEVSHPNRTQVAINSFRTAIPVIDQVANKIQRLVQIKRKLHGYPQQLLTFLDVIKNTFVLLPGINRKSLIGSV